MKNNSPPALRALPSVDFVMNLERAKLMGDSYGRDSVITEVKQQLNNLRTEIPRRQSIKRKSGSTGRRATVTDRD